MKGRRRRVSAMRPDTPLVTAAVASATPSTRPTTAAGAPITVVMKMGRIG